MDPISCPPVLALAQIDQSAIKAQVAAMDDDQKVGQLLMSCFFDFSPAAIDGIAAQVARFHLGGIFHFSCPPADLARSLERLQAEARFPLLVAADYEIGPGWVVEGSLRTPRPMVRGAGGREEDEYRLGQEIALQARTLGTNLNFSPVVDLNTNPLNPDVNIRAWGEDRDQVVRLAVPHVRGMQDHGLLATLKHFPGNGATDMDQHINAALIDTDQAAMEDQYLETYRRVFAQADPACVMVAHLEVPALTRELNPRTGRPVPASVSRELIEDRLRKDLGFEGLAISDAMNMGGVLVQYSRQEAAVKAIQAGLDMLLLFSPGDMEIEYQALRQAVADGRISQDRLNQAVGRVLTAKARLGLGLSGTAQPPANSGTSIPPTPLPRPGTLAFEAVFNRPDLEAWCRNITRQGLCCLINRDHILPLQAVKGRKVLVLSSFNPDRDTLENQGQTSIIMEDITPRLLEARGAVVSQVEMKLHMDGGEMWRVMQAAREADLVFLNLFMIPTWAIGSMMPNKSTLRLFMNGLPMIPGTLVVTSFGDPYVVRQFPAVGAYLCTYDESAVAQELAVQAWLGEIPVHGRSPVSLPGIFGRGDGLDLEPRT